MKIQSLLFLSLTILALNACNKGSDEPQVTGNNRWDGKYRVTGTLTDMKEPIFVWPGDTFQYNMVTVSATQIKMVPIVLGIDGHLLRNMSNLTYYGDFGVVATLDPTTNKVTSVTNSYGQPSPKNGRSAVLDPSGVNAYDPATKSIKIKYWMDETGFAGHRTAFDETWIYVGIR